MPPSGRRGSNADWYGSLPSPAWKLAIQPGQVPELRAALKQPPLSSMPVECLSPAIEDRTVEILARLADQGKQRAPSIPDLIIAATAELAGLTVLHLDKDFDLIAGITGQPTERLNIRPPAADSDAGRAEA